MKHQQHLVYIQYICTIHVFIHTSINIYICTIYSYTYIHVFICTGCSKKNRTTLVVNILRITNDTTILFGLYDTETHIIILCTTSIHFNMSSICHVKDNKAVHEFLPCSAQHICIHQCIYSCDPRTKILQVCHLGVVDNISKKCPQKKNRGLCLVIMGTRWLVRLSQSSDLEIFHSRRLERLRTTEG